MENVLISLYRERLFLKKLIYSIMPQRDYPAAKVQKYTPLQIVLFIFYCCVIAQPSVYSIQMIGGEDIAGMHA